MDFKYSQNVARQRRQVEDFMAEHIYPNLAFYLEQVETAGL